MYCKDVNACFSEINAYCNGTPTGRVLLVNTENYDVYQQIRTRLDADITKNCIYISDCCPDEHSLPDLDDAIDQATKAGCYVLMGLSQVAMLRSAAYMDQLMGVLLEKSARGHSVVLLDHCEQYLRKYFAVHPDIQKRVVLTAGNTSTLPRIRVAVNKEECIGYTPYSGIRRLLAYFERLTDEQNISNPEVAVVTSYSSNLFRNALYSVTACDGVYESLVKKYPEISAGTEKEFGTDEQWKYLARLLQTSNTLSAIADRIFGSAINLQSHISEVIDENDSDKLWLLWLIMKVFGAKGNKYLSKVLARSKSVVEFEELIYMEILNYKYDEKDFHQYYIERKRMIDSLPENLMLLDVYCEKIGVFQEKAVYYLTDASEKEELTFMQCLAIYDYPEEELLRITAVTFPALYSYLQKFAFNVTNTKVPETDLDLRDILTEYFHQYKLQKLTNRIYTSFMDKVESFATTRPYNKLQARSTVVNKLDKKNTQLFFFDALGVEYLAYIMDRCKQYGLVAEVSVAHCELPSITSKNKEFIQFFPGGANDIKDLDELKHHNQVINYEQCKVPVHLFRELEIIDAELKKIQSKLKQDYFEKAIIISDHGASRLAVIHEQETDLLQLDEKGQHSGRCCPAETDPNIPYASYWDGYSILANYDRFKGGRKANVEVHGGASLEEVIIPIITLTKKTMDIDICFVNPIITLKGREPATIVVYANIPLSNPKLVVNEKVYQGEFCEDSKHAKFVMPELKRTKEWTADFYDGDKKLAEGLPFRVKKGTQEQMLFNKKPF